MSERNSKRRKIENAVVTKKEFTIKELVSLHSEYYKYKLNPITQDQIDIFGEYMIKSILKMKLHTKIIDNDLLTNVKIDSEIWTFGLYLNNAMDTLINKEYRIVDNALLSTWVYYQRISPLLYKATAFLTTHEFKKLIHDIVLWSVFKQIWIGYKKPNEMCYLSLLPIDIIRVIINLLL